MTVTVKGVLVELTPVESSNIAGVAYTPLDGIAVLVVQFKSGAVYVYRCVSPLKHAALMAAKSKGRYLQREIVENPAAYPYECVQPVRIFR